MITFDGKQYRNLEEQVLQNKDDIKYLLQEGGTLNEFGLKVVGEVGSETQLPDPTTYAGEFGDAFVVGLTAPYNFYIFTRAFSGQESPFWFNIGEFPLAGPVGPVGPQGEPGPVGRGSQWTTGNGEPTAALPEGDMYLQVPTGNVYRRTATAWELVTNIKGPQGVPGPQGIAGPTGPRGVQGPAGPVGPAGDPFTIAGTVTSTAQLPDPASVSRATAYLVNENNVNYLYIITGEEGNLLWTNTGSFGGGSSVYENGAFVQRFNVDNINNEIVALQNLVDNNTDATTELTTRMANIEQSAAQKNASNIAESESSEWVSVLGVAKADASNLTSANVESWKGKLQYAQITEIWSGSLAPNTNLNIDLTPYKYIIAEIELYNVAQCYVFCDILSNISQFRNVVDLAVNADHRFQIFYAYVNIPTNRKLISFNCSYYSFNQNAVSSNKGTLKKLIGVI